MKLMLSNGDELTQKDVRQNNLKNIIWVTKDRERIPIGSLADSHIRNIALMLMGFSDTEFFAPDRVKIVWLTALRMEWESRVPLRRALTTGGMR